jgi:hypothetical protein
VAEQVGTEGSWSLAPITIELTLDKMPGTCLRPEREEWVPCPGKITTSKTCLAFETSSKRRRSFPSETRVKRGDRVVHGDVELIEKLGLKLTRFRGHPTFWVEGVHDVEAKSTLPT